MGCIVDDVTSGIDRSVCCIISRRIDRSVGWSVDRLRYFVFASTFFGHRIEGTLATTSLVRALRSSSGVGTCYGSAVSRTSFFDLSSCDANIGLEASNH
jgi:hypothetical protein